MTGWIKLHRSIVDWEWYHDTNMMRLFLHLLLKANHKPAKWRGIDVARGQVVIGRKALSDDTGLTEQQVRTCLKRFASTGEISTKSTNQYTLLTIENYSKFQSDSETVTSEQPANNQRITNEQPADNHKQECKEEKEGKKKETAAVIFDFSAWPKEPSEGVLGDWVAHRKKRKLSISQTVITRMGGELHKAAAAGFSVDDCLGEAVERGWQGIKADWMLSTNAAAPAAQQNKYKDLN